MKGKEYYKKLPKTWKKPVTGNIITSPWILSHSGLPSGTAGLVLCEQGGSWTPGTCMQDSMRFL